MPRQQRKCMCLCVWCKCDTCQKRSSEKKLFGANVFRHCDIFLVLQHWVQASAVAPAITWGLVIVLARKWRKVVCLSIAFECLYKRYAISNVLCVQITLYYANQRAAVSQLMSQDWAKITENVRYCFLYPVM